MKREMLIVNGGYLGTHDDENDQNEVEPMLPISIDGTVPEQNKHQHSFNRQEADDNVQPMLPAGMGVRGNGISNT